MLNKVEGLFNQKIYKQDDFFAKMYTLLNKAIKNCYGNVNVDAHFTDTVNR